MFKMLFAYPKVLYQPAKRITHRRWLPIPDEGRFMTGDMGDLKALLGRLARAVWSVERRPELAAAAAANLAAEGVENVRVIVGDGTEGAGSGAPYDAIVVAAAHPLVPPPLAAQLEEGGRLVQPIGPGGADEVTLFRRRGGVLARERVVTGARFVPLYGRHGFTPRGDEQDGG